MKLYTIIPNYNIGTGYGKMVRPCLTTDKPEEIIPYLKKLIEEEGDELAHLSVFAHELGKPLDLSRFDDLSTGKHTNECFVFHTWKQPLHEQGYRWADVIDPSFIALVGLIEEFVPASLVA